MSHLIFVVKYRKQLLIKYGNEIKQIFSDIAEEKNFKIIEMEVDKDHIHLLVSYKPYAIYIGCRQISKADINL